MALADGQPFSWRHQLHYAGVWDPADALAIVTAVMGEVDTHLMGAMSNQVTAVAGEIIDLADVTHAAVVFVDGTDGGVARVPLPLSTTVSILHHVASRIRGGKPHTFLTGFTTAAFADTTPQSWSAGTVAQADSYDSFVATVLNGAQATMGALQYGVVHYFRHHVALDPPVFEPFVGAGSADSRVHGRTRRLGRV